MEHARPDLCDCLVADADEPAEFVVPVGVESGLEPVASAVVVGESPEIRRGDRSLSDCGLGGGGDSLAVRIDDPGGVADGKRALAQSEIRADLWAFASRRLRSCDAARPDELVVVYLVPAL